MTSWMEVLGQWKLGILYPHWAALAHWGYGEARFLFYPPASWTLGAALGSILPWRMVPGAYCWIVLMLAGAAMYRLAREWLSPTDALFAAVFYALNPYHLLIVYWRSAFAELMATILLPLLLLCLLRIEESGFRSTLWLALTLAGGWLTNIPAAVMIYYSAAGLAVACAAREFVRTRSWSPPVWRPLVRTAFAMLMGAGLVSFYLLPAIYEQRWIDVGQVLSPGVRPQDNFLFTTTTDPEHNHFNLLISSVAAVEIGMLALVIWFARRKKRVRTDADQTPWTLLTAWSVGSTVLMFSGSNLLWQHLPKFRFVQLPFRWLLCLNAALALLLAMAAKRWTSRSLVCVVLLAVVIFAGHHFQPPWWNTAGDIDEMSDNVADGTGYEGADEYVPAGADATELNKDFPLVADSLGKAQPAEFMDWGPLEKHFVARVDGSQPGSQSLTLRLFNYPAWEVTVNGERVETQTKAVTGQMILLLRPGRNEVRVHFGRTRDRTIGDAASLISAALFIFVWITSFGPKSIGPGTAVLITKQQPQASLK